MTTKEFDDLEFYLGIIRNFKYDIIIIDHFKENLKYKTNIRVNIYHKSEIIFTYDTCIDGRKNVITNAIEMTQYRTFYNFIVDFIKNDVTYNNILNSKSIVEAKRIEVEEDLSNKFLTIYIPFDYDKDYKTTNKIRFIFYNKYALDINDITMFDKFDISIKSKYDGNIVKTGSIIKDEIKKLDIQKEYLDLLELFSEVIKHKVTYFNSNISENLDLEIHARLVNQR